MLHTTQVTHLFIAYHNLVIRLPIRWRVKRVFFSLFYEKKNTHTTRTNNEYITILDRYSTTHLTIHKS